MIVLGMGRRGFTLIELMIVVAIIGILAAIAIPKFAELIRKSNEGSTKGNLGAIRSALTIYYSDMEGQYPDHLGALTTAGKYMSDLPKAHAAGYHSPTTSQQITRVSAVISDYGGWMYDDIPTSSDFGRVFLNCTHTDTKGTFWSAY
jgi:prepilin-type N-terminal cleavage/methylation domain-containing protein